MFAFLTCLLGLTGAATALCAAQATGAEHELARAEAAVEQVRTLVEAGALPRTRLDEVQKTLDDARDAAFLRRTLYGPDLTDDQTGEMVAAAQRRVARREAELQKAEQLAEAGVTSRLSLTDPREALDSARKELDAAASRARLIHQVTEMARVEMEMEEERDQPSAATVLPYGERYDGDGRFDLTDLTSIEGAFERRFAYGLPISALGQTAVHRALGFDHRNRVDVAINPDQAEGVWLRQYLESNKIPFFAFRMSVPGKATAPHIHIGPLSGRLAKGG